MTEVFDTFGNNSRASALNNAFFLLARVFPILIKLPTSREKLVRKLTVTMGEISNDLLMRTRREKDVNVNETEEEKSIIGLLSTFSKTFSIVP